jgi:hypothetical protein
MLLNAHRAQLLKYCDRVVEAPVITYEFLKCGDWHVNHVIKWRDYCFSNGAYVAISVAESMGRTAPKIKRELQFSLTLKLDSCVGISYTKLS